MDSNKETLNTHADHSSKEIEAISEKMIRKTFKKGTILLREGSLGSDIYFVKKGLLRSYTIDEKGKEHIFMFAPENWIISGSENYGMPSELFIDVLEDSEVDVLNKKVFFDTIIPIQDLNKRVKSLLRRQGVLQKRIIMLMSASAIKRYEDFVETYPEIIQRVPQRMVASYLGITPEALSKVKRKRVKK